MDGSEQPSLLFDRDGQQNPMEWSSDGEHLLYFEVVGDRDIYTYSIKDNVSTPVTITEASERAPGFSPDNKWIVYISNKTGQNEVYVKSFPPTSGEIRISTAGGTEPKWSFDGNAIFYRQGNEMVKADIIYAPSPRTVSRNTIFTELIKPHIHRRFYDIDPAGENFLVIKGPGGTGQAQEIIVITDWFEELKRLAPVNKE